MVINCFLLDLCDSYYPCSKAYVMELTNLLKCGTVKSPKASWEYGPSDLTMLVLKEMQLINLYVT
jgi:hypothetical protein